MTGTEHLCQFREALEWSSWTTNGDVREREGRRVARCSVCHRVRPVRKLRPPTLIEREALIKTTTAISGHASVLAGALARAGLRRSGGVEPPRFRVRTIIDRFGRRGWTASNTEPILERLVRAGFVRAGYRLRGTRQVLDYLVLTDSEALYEVVHPGARTEQRQRLAGARRAVEGLTHPIARDIRSILLGPDAERFSQRILRALVALARHIEAGDVLPANVFSARYLGGAKELRRVRERIEQLVSPLETLGIREGGAVLLVGRTGELAIGATDIDLAQMRPFIGLPRELVMKARWDVPPDGVLVVENMAAFEAACAGDVAGVGDWLVVWSAGYPSRSVRHVIECAAEQRRKVRVWADLDFDGIRIARLIAAWAGDLWLPWRMSAEDVSAAAARRPLVARARSLIEADLRQSPTRPLTDTLRALLEIDAIVEQEVFVGRR